MANKGFAYGMSAQVAKKIAEKRDPDRENEARNWIEAITECNFDKSKTYEENLHDGTILLQLAKKLDPSSVKKINKSTMPFQIMENIEVFLKFCESYGVRKGDLFQVVYLYQATNIPSVTETLFSLGRVCHTKPDFDPSSSSYKGWPTLGPKPSDTNVREFDEETLQKGKNVIGIQAGTNKLASQKGQTFGQRRQVS